MAKTVAQYQALIDAAEDALAALVAGVKSATVGGKTYTRHDIPQVEGLIEFWEKRKAKAAAPRAFTSQARTVDHYS
jgi:hypothetical protein